MADFHCILNPEIDEPLLYREQAISLSCPLQLHLGGVFNSFYPYDWLNIAGISSFKLSIRGTAKDALFSVILHTPGEPPQTIKEKETTLSGEKVELVITGLSPSPGLRLTFQVKSASAIDLSSASWTAISANERRVRLGIVICTYNNEARLKQNIRELIASKVWHEEKPILALANNGTIEDESWLPQERFIKFDQKNLGGAGGFGRGIYEVVHGQLKDQNITHILLMDDDVKFHPEVISRAIAFHKKSQQPVVIGGSMLKLEDPTFLHEAGSNLNSSSTIGTSTDIPTGRLAETGALDHLGKACQFDYNAWWFCSFPTDAVRAVGLPLPIFIHGDDIEYGMRLNAHGFKVYCPGGISLWHESFENKHPTWIRYFDFRNALIRLSFYHHNPPKSLIHQLKHACNRALMRNDYGSYIMAVKAFEDFCKGPHILHDNNIPSQIKALDDLYHQYSHGDSTGRYKLTSSSRIRRKKRKAKLALKYVTANLHALPIPSIRHFETNNIRFPWTDVPCLSDITVKLADGRQVHYNRDIRKCKLLKKRLRAAIKTHKPRLASAQEEWRHKQQDFHSEDFWRQYTE
jgi:galactofuranosylgalactofuranosylrhamnosyl-N-acetylglucosaminyl-diphospho-decaprenol beta-1,5/1,6-galactofuranosyltransferase